MEEFRHDRIEQNAISDDELVELQDRLHSGHECPLHDENHAVRVGDVVEATGLSAVETQQALEALREARLQRVLNELEGPTHRVERAGPSDPDIQPRLNPSGRQVAIRTILDHLPRSDVILVKSSRGKSERQIREEFRDEWVAAAVFKVLFWVIGLAGFGLLLYSLFRR